MSRDDAFLLDMLEAARLATRYVAGTSLDEFLGNVQLQDAVVRRLEIIGEAARRVSDEGRVRYPRVPWPAIIGMRNVLAHQYDTVDLTIVWDAVHLDLPPLIALLAELVPPNPEG
jgi:uncharacterized protein with HEPN domain